MRGRRLLILAVGAAAAILLFVLLRPEGDGDEAAPRPQTTAETETTVETETTAATATEPEPDTRPPAPTLRVAVRGGRPIGGVQRATVERGTRVRIVVRADVPDHVHVHGYDILRDVGPGAPAQLAFEATLSGRFVIELEERGLQIAELEVRP